MVKRYLREAEKIYNEIASMHQIRTKKETKGWIYNEYLEMPMTLSLLGNVKGKKVLDVGCGTGLYAKQLLKRGAKVFGIDISKAMLEIAKKKVKGARFKLASAEKIPYKKNSFDFVLASLVLDYLPKWNKALKEIARVLKPKGLFIFSIGNPIIAVRKKVKLKRKTYYTFEDYFKERKLYREWKHVLLCLKLKCLHITLPMKRSSTHCSSIALKLSATKIPSRYLKQSAYGQRNITSSERCHIFVPLNAGRNSC